MAKKSKHRHPTARDVPKYLKSHDITSSFAYLSMSLAAKVLFDVLCKLRNQLRNSQQDDSFWRSDTQLIYDAGISRNTLKYARKELIAKGFLNWQSHLNTKHREPFYYILDGMYDIGKDKDALNHHYTNIDTDIPF